MKVLFASLFLLLAACARRGAAFGGISAQGGMYYGVRGDPLYGCVSAEVPATPFALSLGYTPYIGAARGFLGESK